MYLNLILSMYVNELFSRNNTGGQTKPRRSTAMTATLRSGASMMDLRTNGSKLLRPLGATQFLDDNTNNNTGTSAVRHQLREYEAWGREYIGSAGMARFRKAIVAAMSMFMIQVS
jgi:hypothetical protein